MRLSDEDRRLLRRQVAHVRERGRVHLMEASIQHGRVTTWDHSVGVATTALAIAAFLRLRVRRDQMVRAALLHDYFLYDWHEKNAGHRFHGFTHPATALKNAQEDFMLTPVEKDIIARHMFPLCPIPPRCREAWLVCAADKYCALLETLTPLLRSLFSTRTS